MFIHFARCILLGTIGGTYAKPLLVVPEVMIGALGRLQVLPRFDAKMQVQVRSLAIVIAVHAFR